MKKLFWILSGVALAIVTTMTTIKMKNIISDLPKGKKSYGKRQLSKIKQIVIHHSAIDGFTPFDYAKWHIARGWPGIGYHFVIDSNGIISQTNELDTVSYHTKGFNTQSIGIALSGNLSNHIPSDSQKQALIKLIKDLKKQLGISLIVKGHGELTKTECPGKLLNLNEIRNLV